MFGPEIYTIIKLDRKGALLEREDNKQKRRRHFDDIKPCPIHKYDNITWFYEPQKQPDLCGTATQQEETPEEQLVA